jgi:hypothetical protein
VRIDLTVLRACRPTTAKSGLACATALLQSWKRAAKFCLSAALSCQFLLLNLVGSHANVFSERPSPDTTPIEFSVGSIQYKVPRNFIIAMDHWSGGPQPLAVLKVEYPSFQPMNEENKGCFLKTVRCNMVEFTIQPPTFGSLNEGFENRRHLFNQREPEHGPFGFDLYTIGHGDTRIETYRKSEGGETSTFECFGAGALVCRSFIRTKSGGVIMYNFYRDQLENAEAISIRLRTLVDSFTVGGTK